MQLFLWVGSWGIVDTMVWAIAPSEATVRLGLYGAVAASGFVCALPLLQMHLRRTARGPELSDPSAPLAPGLLLTFPVAVALCSGLWGTVWECRGRLLPRAPRGRAGVPVHSLCADS